jgi:hypothetical protein
MPKYHPNQTKTHEVLCDCLAFVARVTESSTEADKALLAIAKQAAKYASIWVRCNTENGGRGEMRAHGRALNERAITDSDTLVSCAFESLGLAFQQFASCNYANAAQYAIRAKELATTFLNT